MNHTYTWLSNRQREIWNQLVQLEIQAQSGGLSHERLLEEELQLVHELGEVQAAMEVRMGRVLV